MTIYIEKEVEKIRDDPTPGESIVLLVGVEPSAIEEFSSEIEKLGGDIIEELPFETLRVKVPQETVSSICAMEGIESIETESAFEVLSQGNGYSHQASTQ